jgi:hypothetical protein
MNAAGILELPGRIPPSARGRSGSAHRPGPPDNCRRQLNRFACTIFATGVLGECGVAEVVCWSGGLRFLASSVNRTHWATVLALSGAVER